ncbi:MAG: UxaA family hydrolase [Desulfomonilaceae bacterium]
MLKFLVHEKSDSVGVATVDMNAGENAEGLFMDSQETVQIKVLNNIPLGHKIALKDFKVSDTVIKYGHDIGEVTSDIRAGEHVHTQNLRTKRW